MIFDKRLLRSITSGIPAAVPKDNSSGMCMSILSETEILSAY